MLNNNSSQLFQIKEKVYLTIKKYCYDIGFKPGPGINSFIPHNPISAFIMARRLMTELNDAKYIVISPEGYVYGWFFHILGVPLLEIHVDFPPSRATPKFDLNIVTGQNVLLIEDDVMSGSSLRLAIESLENYQPKQLFLYLGHSFSVQHLDKIPSRISRTYLAEDFLVDTDAMIIEEDFIKYFSSYFK